MIQPTAANGSADLVREIGEENLMLAMSVAMLTIAVCHAGVADQVQRQLEELASSIKAPALEHATEELQHTAERLRPRA